MNKDDLTVVKIRKGTLEIIRKFGKIHGQSPAQFFDKLSTLLVLGIDELMNVDVEELRRSYPYSDVLVSADIRNIIGSGKNE
jgi:hypothetical protein